MLTNLARTGLDAARAQLRGFFRDERAQDIFEYVLIIGVVTVAVLIAVATPVGENLINAVVDGTCKAINGIDGKDDPLTNLVNCDDIRPKAGG